MTHAPAVWYLMRASGVVTLLLLTLALGLGIATSNRWRPAGSRLYVTTTLHRNASLLAVVFLAVHVLTAVVDPDAGVGVASVVFPVGGTVWLAAGTLALDALAAVTITSLLRRRLGYRLWRAVHWSAYAAWPLAVAHGLGMGSDDGTWWLDLVTLGCIAAAAGAVTWRLLPTSSAPRAAERVQSDVGGLSVDSATTRSMSSPRSASLRT
jgi:sulfoxide reductase heme-binding subunit YedZ